MPTSELGTEGILPAWLVERGIVVRTQPGFVTHPDCEHGCHLIPFRDESNRLVVECPTDPPCWEGRIDLPPGADEFVKVDGAAIARALASANGLVSSSGCAVPQTWFCGRRPFRGQHLLVYLTGDLTPSLAYAVSRKAKSITHCHALLLHGCSVDAPTRAAAAQFGVAMLPLPDGSQWNFKLDLVEAYDQLLPYYRPSRETDNAFIFEDVTMEFACEPGRHVVKILGQVHPDCVGSDKYFSMLLYLAACRKIEPNVYDGGWVNSSKMGIGDKRKELDELWKHLEKWDEGHIPGKDLRLLVRSNPGRDGTIRLALDPANIRIDSSVKKFVPLNLPGTSPRSKDSRYDGQNKHDSNMKTAAAEASRLVREACRIAKI